MRITVSMVSMVIVLVGPILAHEASASEVRVGSSSGIVVAGDGRTEPADPTDPIKPRYPADCE